MTSRIGAPTESRETTDPWFDPEAVGRNLDELQEASHYRYISRLLRPSKIRFLAAILMLALVYWGSVLYFGYSDEYQVRVLYGLSGILLLIRFMFSIGAPTHGRIVLLGFVLVFVGIVSPCIGIAYRVLVTHDRIDGVCFGVMIILWGSEILAPYGLRPRQGFYRKIPTAKPSDEMHGMCEGIMKGMLKAGSKKTPNLIEFKAWTFLNRFSWKGRFEEGFAVFVSKRDAVFVRKDQVRFDSADETQSGMRVRVTVRFGKRTMGGTLTVEDYRKYSAWKNESPEPNG